MTWEQTKALEGLNVWEKGRLMSEGPLTEADRRAILRETQEILATEEHMSRSRLAHVIGCSPATVSQILGGKYKGDVDKYLRLARMWLRKRAGAVELPENRYVATSIGEQILTICDLAANHPCVGIVKTTSGCGKTVALREKARRVGNRAGAYLQAGEAICTKRDLLFEIARILGVTLPASITTSGVYTRVRAHLADIYDTGRGFSYLLLVDEATTLRPSAINMLRNLHDDEACRAAIVLADTISRMDGFLYGRGGIAGGNEQLRSRSKAQFICATNRPIARADVKLVADSILASLRSRISLDRRAVDYLYRLVWDPSDEQQVPGTLRNVVARLHNVHYVATRRKWRAEYNAAQLDWVASLAGEPCTIDHGDKAPFAKQVA